MITIGTKVIDKDKRVGVLQSVALDGTAFVQYGTPNCSKPETIQFAKLSNVCPVCQGARCKFCNHTGINLNAPK